MARVYYYEDDPLKTGEGLARYSFASSRVEGRVVLDIGCGARKGPVLLAKKASRVVGLDTSAEAISFCARRWASPKVQYVVGDATALPFGDRSFDAVVSLEVLEHVRAQALFLKEVRRVLRDDGVCILSTPNRAVMSPEGVFANPDHVKELDTVEFRGLLSEVFGHVRIYGQKPSPRAEEVRVSRQESYREVSRIPVVFRRLLPEGLRRYFFGVYAALRSRVRQRAVQEDIGEEDFPIGEEEVERASYLVAVCRP